VTLAEAQQELAQALEPLKDVVPDLQVYGWRNQNPTPPSLDVFPGDPFQVGAGFGHTQKRVFFTVRARVSTADQDTQALLLRFLDPADDASVEAALAEADAVVAGDDGYVSGFRDELDGLLACEWRVSKFL
jgi:hypothetical protein